MRISPVVIWLTVIALLGVTWTLSGCPPQAEEQATRQAAPDTAELPEEGSEDTGETAVTDAAPDDETAAPAPVDGEEIVEPEPTSLSTEQAQAALDLKVDLDRAYGESDFGPLRTVLRLGSDEQKVKVRETLEALLLNSRVAHTRAGAATVLALNVSSSVELLTQAALHDPEKQVRRQAIEALREAAPSPELLAALQRAGRAEDPDVRAAALTTEMDVRLKSYKPGDDTAWMARLLGQTDDDASAQLQIKLEQRGAPVLPAAIDVLQTASDSNARAAAACAVMVICAGTSPKQQEFAELSKAMITKAGLAQPEPANLDGLKPLENAVANDSSWKVRAIAAQGLGYLGQASSAPILGQALHDEHEEVRWWAALGLETVPSEAALEDLAIASRRDSSERVRAAAVRSIGWVDSDKAVLPLVLATADESSAVRQAAAEELARFKSPASLEAMVKLFKDTDEDVRWAAVVAAGELRDKETVPALIEAMHDPSPMVANAAERALQRMGMAEQRFGFEDET